MKGFTITELLIVIAIIFVVSAAAVPIYGQLQGSAQLNDVSDQIIQALRTAQTRAQARYQNAAHGVYFADNAFVLYQGSSYLNHNSDYTTTTTLDSALTVTTTIGVSTSTGLNLALDKPALASSQANDLLDPPMRQQANDGEINIIWLTDVNAATGGWWQVDLGQIYGINQARVTWRDSGTTNRCTAWRIQGSNDAVEFNTVWNGNPSANAQTTSYRFDSTGYRHWRFVCDTAVDTIYALAEVEIFAAHGATRDINFSRGLGQPNTTGTIVINHESAGGRALTINHTGVAEAL